MKLTDALWRWKKALPGGHLWRGKYKLYRQVTPLIAAKKIAEYEIEERNMFLLRHPYLTIEQSQIYTLPSGDQPQVYEKDIKEWKQHKNLGDRFGFLKVSDKWE